MQKLLKENKKSVAAKSSDCRFFNTVSEFGCDCFIASVRGVLPTVDVTAVDEIFNGRRPFFSVKHVDYNQFQFHFVDIKELLIMKKGINKKFIIIGNGKILMVSLNIIKK